MVSVLGLTFLQEVTWWRKRVKNGEIVVRILTLVVLLIASCAVGQEGCFSSDDTAKTPFSVPISQIEERINSDEASDGIELSISTEDRMMRIDLIAVPGETSAAAVLRVIMMIGRLTERSYAEMRFADEGQDIFVIDGAAIQEIGCQFVWGEEGNGQNPIHLLRLFADALRTPNGTRVAPQMTGALLGDTTIALDTINEQFHPEWTLRTVEIR